MPHRPHRSPRGATFASEQGRPSPISGPAFALSRARCVGKRDAPRTHRRRSLRLPKRPRRANGAGLLGAVASHEGLGGLFFRPYRAKSRYSPECVEKLFWKIERSRSMTYAPEHVKVLFDRSIRRRMEGPRAPRSGRQQAGTSEDPQLARDPRCHLLRPEKRLPLEALAPRLSALGERLLVV
jgi:hypothetical protein